MTAGLSAAVVLFDPDAQRGEMLAARLGALGLRCRAHSAPPAIPDPNARVTLTLADSLSVGIARLRLAFPRAVVVAVGTDRSQDAAVRAFRAGADDFLWLGSEDAEFARLIGDLLGNVPPVEEEQGDLVGGSRPMRQMRELIRRVAPSNATVLVTGETGTGKDCAASLLHRLSPRAAGPLVALNCAAIPEALLEGELFGYERGAFSGALSAFPGRLKLADGGTLFLDEIGELSLSGQAKILRAIETREAWRLGARTPTRFDVRIVAATNRDLKAETQAGRFRLDLFYRIAVAQVHMPALRERPEDIGPIARHVLGELVGTGCAAPRLDDAALRRLEAHDWPGNVRELRNVLEVALVTSEGGRIRTADLIPMLGVAPAAPIAPRDAALEDRANLVSLLARVGGNKKRAAEALNCSRMTLYRRLARYGLTAGAEQEGAASVTCRVTTAVTDHVTRSVTQPVRTPPSP
jgi:DNA-binding NtrC family response regulator